ncbi:MAG: hypothetical protein HPY83_13390 [Anaerolineae bacterium]|nr:hypothetical protein [Anaerolineae bacterium]
MNARERFYHVMHFQQPDRLPFWDLEGFSEQAVRLWCQQGFPLGATPDSYFGFDHRLLSGSVRLDEDPIPNFVPRKVAEDEEWVTTVDRYGFTVRTLKRQSVSPVVYYYVGGLVKDEADWAALSRRYDGRDLRRYPKTWGEDLIAHSRSTSGLYGLFQYWGPGRASKNGYTMGLEEFLVALHDRPALVEAMFSFWADFLIDLLREMVSLARVDYVFVSDDGLGYKDKSLISPAMYRRFWMPHHRKVNDFLRASGVDCIGFYSSGNVEALIPSMLEAGYNTFAPLECAAGMDAVRLRREFGSDILLLGNLSREAFQRGPEAIEEEFYAKVPWLVEQGGFIPALDDLVMPDIPFAHYAHFVELVRSFGG